MVASVFPDLATLDVGKLVKAQLVSPVWVTRCCLPLPHLSPGPGSPVLGGLITEETPFLCDPAGACPLWLWALSVEGWAQVGGGEAWS